MRTRAGAGVLLLAFAGCLPPPRPAVVAAAPQQPSLRLVAPADWPVFTDDLDPSTLAQAAANTIAYLRGQGERLVRIADRSVGTEQLVESAQELLVIRSEAKDDLELNARLRSEFDLYAVRSATGPADVHFSSYYSPRLRASPVQQGEFKYPIYRRPPDLLVVPLGPFNEKWKGESITGRLDKNGSLVPYFSRRDIDVRKELEGRGLELAWLADDFDRLDLHIQGAGILSFPDGKEMLAQTAATNDLPYNSVGLSLVGSGAMSREEISHERLRQYLHDHPEGEAWLLSRDPRYSFFTLEELPPGAESFGSIGKPLVAGRSIAIDPKFIPLGMVAFAEFPLPQADPLGRLLGKYPTTRFVFCQDAGGAIKGPARVDFYAGHGPQAQTIAQNVWDKGRLYLLVKKFPPRQR